MLVLRGRKRLVIKELFWQKLGSIKIVRKIKSVVEGWDDLFKSDG